MEEQIEEDKVARKKSQIEKMQARRLVQNYIQDQEEQLEEEKTARQKLPIEKVQDKAKDISEEHVNDKAVNVTHCTKEKMTEVSKQLFEAELVTNMIKEKAREDFDSADFGRLGFSSVCPSSIHFRSVGFGRPPEVDDKASGMSLTSRPRPRSRPRPSQTAPQSYLHLECRV